MGTNEETTLSSGMNTLDRETLDGIRETAEALGAAETKLEILEQMCINAIRENSYAAYIDADVVLTILGLSPWAVRNTLEIKEGNIVAN